MKKQTDFSSKPYNRCIPCHHRTACRCNGPRTSEMDLARWCEFMRDMKEINELTNAEIAEKSGVSVKRIEQLMAQNCEQDIMRDTARRIENAILGPASQYPCYLAFEESMPNTAEQLNTTMRDLEHALNDNQGYKAMLESLQSSHAAEIQKLREESQAKIDFLLEQVVCLRRDNDNLWAENKRKSRLVDSLLERENVLPSEKKL